MSQSQRRTHYFLSFGFVLFVLVFAHAIYSASLDTVILLGIIFLLPSIYYAFKKIIYKRYIPDQIQSIPDFLASIQNTNYEYCLILRPFYADGFFYMPEKRTWMDRLFLPGEKTITIESLFSKIAKEQFGLETVTVIDQYVEFLPPGPHCVSAVGSGEAWRDQVHQLITRALYVVFIYPPTKGSPPAVAWELNESIRFGMIDRMFIFLPPKKMKKQMKFAEVLEVLIKAIPDLLEGIDVDPEEILAIHYGSNETFVWYQKDKYGSPNDDTYKEAIIDLLERGKTSIINKSFTERYQYFSSSVKANRQQLKLISSK